MTHPNSSEGRSQEENPFRNLRIDNNDVLDTFKERYACEQCHKSRKFFCYTCFTPHPNIRDVIPRVKLPLKVDIIKHQREIDGKSTAAHAAILCPDNVKVYIYPDIPTYDCELEHVVLIFPSQTATDIPQLFSNNLISSECNHTINGKKGMRQSTLLKNIVTRASTDVPKLQGCLPITRAVFIDSTWNQSRGIYKDARVQKLPCIVLQNRISQFWRHQRGSPRWYLATIEAIHQFVLELHLNAYGVHSEYKGLSSCFIDETLEKYKHMTYISKHENAYNGQYDNLLYFFEYMYKLIHTYYKHEQLYAYKRRMS